MTALTLVALAWSCDPQVDDGAARHAASTPVRWFRDGTEEAGVQIPEASPDGSSKGFGVAVGDVDGDGMLDLVVAPGRGPASLWLGRGLRFEGATAGSGLDPRWPCRGVALGDLDSDRDLDLVLGSDAASPALRVFRNTGAGSFLEDQLGVPRIEGDVVGVLLADLDLDGSTDLYVVRHGPPGGSASGRADLLLRNAGEAGFTDLSPDVSLDVEGYGWTAASIDHDRDGDPDVFVANDTFAIGGVGAGRGLPGDLLFRNDGIDPEGRPAFAEVGAEAGASAFRSTMGALVADLTADGISDLYLSDVGGDDLLAASPSGRFEDVTATFGLDVPRGTGGWCPVAGSRECLWVSWGAAHADLDLDGNDDLLVVHGGIFGGDTRQPIGAWRGLPSGGFEPVDLGLERIDGRAVVPADLDDDGDLDLAVTTRDGPLHVFENLSAPAGRSLRVRLRGTRSNSEGLGAEVVLRLASGRTLVRRVGAGGIPHSWAPAEAFFGLGQGEPADIEVRWPDGTVQRVSPIGTDPRIEVEEEVRPR